MSQEALAKALGYVNWRELKKLPQADTNPYELASMDCAGQVSIVVRLCQLTGIYAGDAIFSLCRSGIIRHSPENQLAQRLDLLAKVYRATTIPRGGSKKSGDVGRVEALGKGQQMILRSHGSAFVGVTHKHPSALVADFEYKSPREPLQLFIPARFYLAYGKIDLEGGSILVSRDRIPLWFIPEVGNPMRLHPWERINTSRIDDYFWDPEELWYSTDWIHKEQLRLQQFGVTELPALVNALPLFFERSRDELHALDDAVPLLEEHHVMLKNTTRWSNERAAIF